MKLKNLIFMLLVVTLLIFTSCTKQQNNKILTPDGYEKFYILDIADGDTIKVLDDGQPTSVRFIGIDTPETHVSSKPLGEYGTEAYYYTRKCIKVYSKDVVYMDFDQDKYGNYGRLLGYIYYKKDGEYHFLNEELLKNGLARPLFYDDSSKNKATFIKAYEYAFEHKNGIFSKYNDSTIVKTPKQLTKKDIGKIRWIEFTVGNVGRSGSFYKIYSKENDFVVSIRQAEFNAFFKSYNLYDLKGKKIRYFGEVWKEASKYEILGRAKFEIKVLN